MFLSCEASCNLAHRDERWTVNLRGLEFSLAAWSFQGAKRAASDSAPTANTCDTSLTTCYLELLKAPFLPRVRDWPRGAKGAQICSAVTSTVFGGKIGISMSRLERRQ